MKSQIVTRFVFVKGGNNMDANEINQLITENKKIGKALSKYKKVLEKKNKTKMPKKEPVAEASKESRPEDRELKTGGETP